MASAAKGDILLAGTAGLAAGAMSMAAGEYVSVSSQSDTESADLDREREELRIDPVAEENELAAIYMKRGLGPELARQVARELTEEDALGAHARDELGISHINRARPLQAAFTSAATFSVGAAAPLLAALVSPERFVVPAIAVSSLLYLAALGCVGAKTGGANPLIASARVTLWGAIAMTVTAAIGALIGQRI